MKISQKETESLSKLSAFERYKYFIKRVADTELMYTLIDERGNLSIAEIEGKTIVSFWSAEEYAIINAVNQWKEYKVKELTLAHFENHIIDIVTQQAYLLNIFPIKDKTGFIVNINEFARDLVSEMEKYS